MIFYNFGERIARSITFNIADWVDGHVSFGQGLVNVGRDTFYSFVQLGIDEWNYFLPPLPPLPPFPFSFNATNVGTNATNDATNATIEQTGATTTTTSATTTTTNATTTTQGTEPQQHLTAARGVAAAEVTGMPGAQADKSDPALHDLKVDVADDAETTVAAQGEVRNTNGTTGKRLHDTSTTASSPCAGSTGSTAVGPNDADRAAGHEQHETAGSTSQAGKSAKPGTGSASRPARSAP
jgi:hypothetical protein